MIGRKRSTVNPRESGASLLNRDGLDLTSKRSEWARVNRHYQEVERWNTDARAIAQVDARTLEAYSYHPAPLNDVRYNVDVVDQRARLARENARQVKQLREKLAQLLAEQDQLWTHNSFNDAQNSRWDEIETEIGAIIDQLRIEFGERVEVGGSRIPPTVEETKPPLASSSIPSIPAQVFAPNSDEGLCMWCGAPASYVVIGSNANAYACSIDATMASQCGLKVEHKK